MATVSTLLHGNSLDTTEGGIAFCAVTLIETTDGSGKPYRLIVDPGSSGRRSALATALRRRDLTANDVDAVVLTHAHWDHMENLDEFPRATIWAHPDEIAYVAAPHSHDTATPRWTHAVLAAYNVRPAGVGDELADGVVVLDGRGHSAGTIAVSVTTDSGVAVIAGDVIQNAVADQRRLNPLVFWNAEQAAMSITRILDAADVIYPGHDRAFRHSTSGAIEYVENYTLTLTGPSRDLASLKIETDDGFDPLVFEPRSVSSHEQHRNSTS
jgi:N-acyl homoserine lactone hydrolase